MNTQHLISPTSGQSCHAAAVIERITGRRLDELTPTRHDGTQTGTQADSPDSGPDKRPDGAA